MLAKHYGSHTTESPKESASYDDFTLRYQLQIYFTILIDKEYDDVYLLNDNFALATLEPSNDDLMKYISKYGYASLMQFCTAAISFAPAR